MKMQKSFVAHIFVKGDQFASNVTKMVCGPFYSVSRKSPPPRDLTFFHFFSQTVENF